MVRLQVDKDYPFQRSLDFPLTSEQLSPLDPRCERVQFSNYQFDRPPEEADFGRLAEFLRQYPDIALRIYGSGGTIRDLDFLRHFRFLEKFECDVFTLDSLDGLGYLPPTLKSLYLGQTRKRTFTLRFLEQFPSLQELFIEKHSIDFDAIGSLKHLQRLTLRSVTVSSLALLTRLPRLWSLDIKLGGIRYLEDLRHLRGLKYLELWRILGLEHLEPVSDLVGLQYLFLEDLTHVQNLPSLTQMSQLRRLHIDGLRNLRDLSPIMGAQALEELIVWDAPHLRPEDFEILRGHPSLQRASIGTGSIRRDGEIRQMLGVDEFKRMKEDFEYR